MSVTTFNGRNTAKMVEVPIVLAQMFWRLLDLNLSPR